LHEYLNDFPGKEDVLRYALASIMPENKDADFTWKDFQARNNNELVAILGNFVNRIIVLSRKYFEGKVPAPNEIGAEAAAAVLAQIQGHIEQVENSLEGFRFREAQAEFINVARAGNKYLTDEEPWKKWKNDPEAVHTSLFTCTQIIGKLGILAKAFLPRTAEAIFDLLQVDGAQYQWTALSQDELIPAGHQMYAAEENKILFEKIEDSVIEEQLQKLEAAAQAALGAAANLTPAKAEITFDDFQGMDIRIGTILEASKVPKSDKLLQFTVDTGLDKRTIVSGVAEYFQPEELIGKQVPVLVNLKPRKIRGVLSQGMILFAEDAAETLHLLNPPHMIDAGSSVN
jgi:methionyl-tRNA synthetase